MQFPIIYFSLVIIVGSLQREEHHWQHLLMGDDTNSAAALPDNLWPTTRTAVGAIDGLHRLTGLPWWATLTLTAVGEPPFRCCCPQQKLERLAFTTRGAACAVLHVAGVRAALLPVTVQQMRASAAFWSLWRQAQAHAQQRGQAASTQWPASPSGRSMQGAAAASAATKASSGSASQASSMLPHLPPHAAPAAAQSTGHHSKAEESASTGSGIADGQAGARGGPAAAGPGSLRDALAEFQRLRRAHNAPHPAWILGAPLLQASLLI